MNCCILYLLQVISLARDHLKIVGEERSAYRTICKTTRQNLKDHYEVDGTLQPPAPGSMVPAMNTEITMHYSFDMAQQVKMYTITYINHYVKQVHYPSDPFQPGPVYFLTPRKCAIFGVCCETIPRQVRNYCQTNTIF